MFLTSRFKIWCEMYRVELVVPDVELDEHGESFHLGREQDQLVPARVQLPQVCQVPCFTWKMAFKTPMAQGRSTTTSSRCGGLGPVGCQYRTLSLRLRASPGRGAQVAFQISDPANRMCPIVWGITHRSDPRRPLCTFSGRAAFLSHIQCL